MDNLNRVVMPLFDLATANLTITLEASFGKTLNTGDRKHNTYITEKRTAFLNPDIYLVFAYKDPDNSSDSFGKNVYTSFPQTDALLGVLDLVYRNVDSGFAEANGALVVRPEFSSPVAITEIGKSKSYIEFKLAVADITENGVPQRMPAVQMTLSGAPGSSLLSINEFKSIYHIIKNTNLVEFKMRASHLYLEEQMIRNQPRSNNSYNNFRSSGSNNGSYNNNYGRSQQNYNAAPYQPRTAYNNVPQGNSYQAAPTMVTPTSEEDSYLPTMNNGGNNYSRQNNNYQNNYQRNNNNAGGNNLPPRSTNTLINAAAVASVPVDNMSFDDDDSIDALLNDLD